jgi:protein-S-isoprenylcysteine O-methyltransferase Ste14
MGSWQKIARRIRVPLGFLFAAAYLYLAHPTILSICLGSAIALLGILIRALASGHVRKNEQLATSGPYAYTRNPLYLGSIIIAAGFAVAARSWWVAAIALVILFVVYVPVIRGEEEFLRARFPEFAEYSRRVPRLFPRLRALEGSPEGFSCHLYWQHREYNAAIGAALMVVALILKIHFER